MAQEAFKLRMVLPDTCLLDFVQTTRAERTFEAIFPRAGALGSQVR